MQKNNFKLNQKDLVNSWNKLLWQKEFVQQYRIAFELHIGNNNAPPLLHVDQILPELVYLRAVSIFDDVLMYCVKSNNLQMPKKFRKNLDGRIAFLEKRHYLKNSKLDLDAIRCKRNKIAHYASKKVLDHALITWDEVDSAIDVIHSEINNILNVGKRPNYKLRGERTFDESDESGIFGVYNYKLILSSDNREEITGCWSARLKSNR